MFELLAEMLKKKSEEKANGEGDANGRGGDGGGERGLGPGADAPRVAFTEGYSRPRAATGVRKTGFQTKPCNCGGARK
jgi:hypothetical protein